MNGSRTTGRQFLLLFCIAAFCLADPADRQLSLSVKHSTEKDEQREADSRPGANANTIVTTVITRTKTSILKTEVMNLGDQAETCELMVGFVGRDLQTDEAVLSGTAKKTIRVEADGSFNEVFSNRFVETERTVDREYNSTRIRKGQDDEGFLVLLKADGEIIAKESNSIQYLKDEWIAQCETGTLASKTGNKKKR